MYQLTVFWSKSIRLSLGGGGSLGQQVATDSELLEKPWKVVEREKFNNELEFLKI